MFVPRDIWDHTREYEDECNTRPAQLDFSDAANSFGITSPISSQPKHIGGNTFKQYLSQKIASAKSMLDEIDNHCVLSVHNSQEQSPAEITARLVSQATGATNPDHDSGGA